MIYLLTTKEHENGLWIEKLKTALENSSASVKVAILEEVIFSLKNPFPSNSVLINRIADSSTFYEETVNFFECCTKLWKIPVWNNCYALASRKIAHSIIFNEAKLNSPNTKRIFNGEVKEYPPTPCLFKPNNGGFSKGIERYDEIPDIVDRSKNGVLQEYLKPFKIYRIWFLQGKVQCSVERTEDTVETCPCASMNDALLATEIPENARREIEEQLLPLVPQANCGSVEYLIEQHVDHRWYFDFNLVSTLPVDVKNSADVWGEDYDPWKQLAEAILAWKKCVL